MWRRINWTTLRTYPLPTYPEAPVGKGLPGKDTLSSKYFGLAGGGARGAWDGAWGKLVLARNGS